MLIIHPGNAFQGIALVRQLVKSLHLIASLMRSDTGQALSHCFEQGDLSKIIINMTTATVSQVSL